MLNTVRKPSSFLIGATYFIDVWYFCAKKKQKPALSRSSRHLSVSRAMFTPSASRQSAVPDFDEAARLPCLETSTPEAAMTIAEVVEISTRPFTKAERKCVKRAFIVPSQDGLSVCFRRKNGSEDFLPLDDKSIGRAWDIVNLKRSVVVTYKDGVQKLRIMPRNSQRFIDIFRKNVY